MWDALFRGQDESHRTHELEAATLIIAMSSSSHLPQK